MASKIIDVGTDEIVNDFVVNFRDTLGKGTYGVIYSAWKNNLSPKCVAKVIMRDEHPKIVEKAVRIYKGFTEEHKNIVKIYDCVNKDNSLYIFMEFCKHGDLNKYFRSQAPIPYPPRVNIMIQVVEGLEFLHGKDIIHRDIKPANILVCDVVNRIPSIKLTDFDLSKFLEPDYETSVMTTNVGTNSFKAPEFWKVNERGKREYHRDVDIYATGLLFLALVQESTRKDYKLIPRLETYNDVSEIHNPIGGTIYERIKYKNGSLEAVKIQEDDTAEIKKAKELIKKMTQAEPKERIKATRLKEELQELERQLTATVEGVSDGEAPHEYGDEEPDPPE